MITEIKCYKEWICAKCGKLIVKRTNCWIDINAREYNCTYNNRKSSLYFCNNCGLQLINANIIEFDRK